MGRLGKDGPQLVAEISVFSAADALQWAESSRLTGHLTFRSAGSQITLRLEEGGILLAASNRQIEGLGRHLFSEGMVDEIDLAAALVYCRESQSRIGTAMVQLEVLSKEDVRKALFDHTVDLATLPVNWTDGWISAEVQPIEQPDGLDPEPADATMVLMEAARRTDELTKIERFVPGDEARLGRGKAPLPPDAPARWRRVLETHQPSTSARDHYESIGGSYFEYLQAAAKLVDLGTLELEKGEESPVTPSPVARAL